MSFVPQYLIKRLLPMDCLHAVDNGVEIHAVNVMMPINIEEIPPNMLDYFDVELDGEKQTREFIEQMNLTVEGKVFNFENAPTELLGMTIPMGAEMVMFLPVPWQAGEEHEICFDVKPDEGAIQIRVKRVIQ